MLALIPARGGSKRLPGKNLRLLGGLPLIAHSIAQALNCSQVTRVVVSTDCPEIAEVSRSFGAEVPFLRPEHLASDEASSVEVFLHALSILKEEELVVLQPTSPLREAADIGAAIALFREKAADSVVSCALEHPIHWLFRELPNGSILPLFQPGERLQATDRVFRPNGSIYVLARHALADGTYVTSRTYPYLMSQQASVDIDTLEDFLFAESLWTLRQESSGNLQ